MWPMSSIRVSCSTNIYMMHMYFASNHSGDSSSDSSSDNNNGAVIALAVLFAIAVIGLVISIVIIVFLVGKLKKQSRYVVTSIHCM